MSNQNRFLLPHTTKGSPTNAKSRSHDGSQADRDEDENSQYSVDTDFDSYWEEEARNPHRNRIRIGRQYQANVPPLLKPGDCDSRKLEELETLSFCSKKSAKVSDSELDHYFTIAKSLYLFASLVETRALLGRDVTIADLNHIRNKEGLSLASVIQPVRQANPPPLVSQTTPQNPSAGGSQSPNSDSKLAPSSSESVTTPDESPLNQNLVRALSHFISLHHPCHHDKDCKKLLKETPLQDDTVPTVSITAGYLRQNTSGSSKPIRSRSTSKNAPLLAAPKEENGESLTKEADQNAASADSQGSLDDWTKEEVELFSKAIEVCGKNFGAIKKKFLPSRSVKSIVEYYYIGSRSDNNEKKKCSPTAESSEACNSPEKIQSHNNNSQGGDGGGPLAGGKSSSNSSVMNPASSSSRQMTSAKTDPSGGSGNTTSSSYDCTKRSSSTDQPIDGATMEFRHNETNQPTDVKPHVDASRMSVYNFDEDLKDESPVRIECPRSGAEVKPLKAKPIVPNSHLDSEAGQSNMGSLKFFMDGQLVLKLNACQEQQEGVEKCHWVQSGERVNTMSRQKRYTKKSNDLSLNGSQSNSIYSNSVVSSNNDDDSKTEPDFTADDDSKESANSFTAVPVRPKSSSASPSPKRPKSKNNETSPARLQQSPIDYNRLAVNNRMKEKTDTFSPTNLVNQATMPWLQANSLAVAAALLGSLPFPAGPGSGIGDQIQRSTNNISVNSKPMDLSLEHDNSKPVANNKSASRRRPKNS